VQTESVTCWLSALLAFAQLLPSCNSTKAPLEPIGLVFHCLPIISPDSPDSSLQPHSVHAIMQLTLFVPILSKYGFPPQNGHDAK
jgi:hypothetical protein